MKKEQIQEEEYAFPYHYADFVSEKEKFIEFNYWEFLNVIKNLILKYPHETILDAGCGDGRLCFELKKYCKFCRKHTLHKEIK